MKQKAQEQKGKHNERTEAGGAGAREGGTFVN